MAPYIIIVLASCAILCASKASLLPRSWRMGVLFPTALVPWIAQSWLLKQSSTNLESFLNGAPELETLCVIAVTQELFCLSVGWPLISGFCRHRKFRMISLAPSLLIYPGVLYLQFSGFRFFPGVKFEFITLGASLIGWLVPLLLAEIIAWHRVKTERIRIILNWEWVVLLLTLSLPSVARFKGFKPTQETWSWESAKVWGILVILVVIFAILTLIWNYIKDKKGDKNELFN